MDLIFPHPTHAEDQPVSHLILTTHVLHRGFQTGAFVGALTGTIRSVFGLLYSRPPSSSSSANRNQIKFAINGAKSHGISPLTRTIIRSTGVGGLVGAGLMGVWVPYKMAGCELIEWQDRAWALLENKGQNDIDRCSVGGGLLGVGATMLLRSSSPALPGIWKMVLGGAGGGSVLGVIGYIGWRLGVRNGERLE